MVARVVPPNKQRGAQTSGGQIEDTLFTLLLALSNRAMIIGNGDPDGAIEATQGALYMDQDAATGDILYIKRLADVSGDKTQGWRPV